MRLERALFWRSGKEWAVRRGSWKLVGGNKGEMMLFNLDDDVGEQNNLAESNKEKLEEMIAAFEKIRGKGYNKTEELELK